MGQSAPGNTTGRESASSRSSKMFPDERAAIEWFEELRWPGGQRFCPDCGSLNYGHTPQHASMPYRCRDCRSYFSVTKGTVMERTRIPLRKWVLAMYMMNTNLKGTSSMKIYRDMELPQKTAWFLMQRIREGFLEGTGASPESVRYGGDRRGVFRRQGSQPAQGQEAERRTGHHRQKPPS